MLHVVLLLMFMLYDDEKDKTGSVRKLSNFNFQWWTKTLYQSNLNHIAFFFALFKGHK